MKTRLDDLLDRLRDAGTKTEGPVSELFVDAADALERQRATRRRAIGVQGDKLDLNVFCDEIVSGVGGFDDFAKFEHVARTPIQAVRFAMRCLANPDLEGSDMMLYAIIKERYMKMVVAKDFIGAGLFAMDLNSLYEKNVSEKLESVR